MESQNGEFDFDWAVFLKDGSDNLNLDFLDQPATGDLSSTPDSGYAFSIGDLEEFLMNDEYELDHNTIVNDSPSLTPKDPSTTPDIVANEGDKDSPIPEKIDDFVDAVDDKRKKRKIMNRDAAVRSRERKKEYVKELEMKSKFYEGECRRLGIMLQYYIAENQALRFSMNTKQESAVLLLESLLLGSLLGYMGIIWLLTLHALLLQAPKIGLMGELRVENEGRRKGRSKVRDVCFISFMLSKSCRGTRSRMKGDLNVALLA